MAKLLYIAAGGALGSVLRYIMSGWTYRFTSEAFPWGTLAVNVLGCFVIGLLWALSERASFAPNTRIFLFTGMLGGFTTFSTYALESFNLIRDGEVGAFAINVLASNLLGLAAVLVGFTLGRVVINSAGMGGAS